MLAFKATRPLAKMHAVFALASIVLGVDQIKQQRVVVPGARVEMRNQILCKPCRSLPLPVVARGCADAENARVQHRLPENTPLFQELRRRFAFASCGEPAERIP